MKCIFNVYLFLRESKSERAQVGEGQREREREAQTLSVEPDAGLQLTNCEIMT